MESGIPLVYDQDWDSDSVHIRINLTRRLGAGEISQLFEALAMWAIAGGPGQPDAIPEYVDLDPEYYTGPLGMWAQIFIDLGTGDQLEIDTIFATLVERLASFDFVVSVMVGSDYGDWSYPPEHRN